MTWVDSHCHLRVATGRRPTPTPRCGGPGGRGRGAWCASAPTSRRPGGRSSSPGATPTCARPSASTPTTPPGSPTSGRRSRRWPATGRRRRRHRRDRLRLLLPALRRADAGGRVPRADRGWRTTLDRALVIHSRDAWDDTFRVLADDGVPARTVFHCFTGGPDEARRALDLGAYLSFSGIVSLQERRRRARRGGHARSTGCSSRPTRRTSRRCRTAAERTAPRGSSTSGAALAAAIGRPVDEIAEATRRNADRGLRHTPADLHRSRPRRPIVAAPGGVDYRDRFVSVAGGNALGTPTARHSTQGTDPITEQLQPSRGPQHRSCGFTFGVTARPLPAHVASEIGPSPARGTARRRRVVARARPARAPVDRDAARRGHTGLRPRPRHDRPRRHRSRGRAVAGARRAARRGRVAPAARRPRRPPAGRGAARPRPARCRRRWSPKPRRSSPTPSPRPRPLGAVAGPGRAPRRRRLAPAARSPTSCPRSPTSSRTPRPPPHDPPGRAGPPGAGAPGARHRRCWWW